MLLTHKFYGKPVGYAGFFLCSLCLVLLLASCGKQEATTGTMGAISGAALGAIVSNDHSRGAGALIGGLAGALLGKELGRSADEETAQDQKSGKPQRTIVTVRNETRHTKGHCHVKWCPECEEPVYIVDARWCPDCGAKLVRERYCRHCSCVFSPCCGYTYCPYCPGYTLFCAL